MVKSQKGGGVWTWFWYQIKTESVLIEMIQKKNPHFAQTVTCSLFSGTASPSPRFCSRRDDVTALMFYHWYYTNVDQVVIALVINLIMYLPSTWSLSISFHSNILPDQLDGTWAPDLSCAPLSILRIYGYFCAARLVLLFHNRVLFVIGIVYPWYRLLADGFWYIKWMRQLMIMLKNK